MLNFTSAPINLVALLVADSLKQANALFKLTVNTLMYENRSAYLEAFDARDSSVPFEIGPVSSK
jgi:hypothetical protein